MIFAGVSAPVFWSVAMARVLIQVPAGVPNKTTVTTTAGSAISTDLIRVTVDDATCGTKEVALAAIDVVKQRLIEGPWPLT